VILQKGEWIACRQELLVRIAEVCEVAGRDFIYTEGLTKGKAGTATWICCEDDRLKFACACKNGSNCSFRCKAMWCTPGGDDNASWRVTELEPHNCKGTVASVKKGSGVPVRASARRGGVGGACGGGVTADGGDGRPPPPSSPSKATHTRPKSNTSFTAYRTDMLARVVRNTILAPHRGQRGR